jgi:hypothetical protein
MTQKCCFNCGASAMRSGGARITCGEQGHKEVDGASVCPKWRKMGVGRS